MIDFLWMKSIYFITIWMKRVNKRIDNGSGKEANGKCVPSPVPMRSNRLSEESSDGFDKNLFFALLFMKAIYLGFLPPSMIF